MRISPSFSNFFNKGTSSANSARKKFSSSIAIGAYVVGRGSMISVGGSDGEDDGDKTEVAVDSGDVEGPVSELLSEGP